MSVVRFISDYHFGHKFMVKLRNFNSTDEMNKHIIEEHNKIVRKKDLTYILGDISMENAFFYPLLDLMNGRKRVILGNHDELKDVPKLLNHVEQVGGMLKYKGIFISHCPVHPTELEYRVSHNIHGHIHENILPDKRYINVCCEVIDYKPKTLEELGITRERKKK